MATLRLVIVDAEERDVEKIAKMIIRYLNRHPNAADSAEGIVNWWLTQPFYGGSIETVNKALEHLLAQGLIKKSYTPGGKIVYSSIKPNTKH